MHVSRSALSRARRALLLPLLLGAAPACQKDPDLRPEGTAGGASRPEDLVCPTGLPGADLVRVQTEDGVVFCMDQREVTWAEYDAFLAEKRGDTSGQPAECSWNAGYEPEYYVMNDINRTSTKCEEHFRPVSKDAAANCLDFCDALAFCAWAGKRLCGPLGQEAPDGGVFLSVDAGFDPPIPPTEFAYACTQGGTTAFPYGDAYSAGRCVYAGALIHADAAAEEIADSSTSRCQGSAEPFDRVYNLGGGVTEWQNHCRGTRSETCLTVGGGVALASSGWTSSSCGEDQGYTSGTTKSPAIGARCCADAEPGRGAAR
ncbi:MAG: SUMF1/EgtB/PvdO family nonheme iron enzyme [Polyangiaceae bacterium]|nr:SUMF1/EgtB/PvdO family nonheme iron enzyme [Polyangiaceae bacterium]